MRMTIAGQEVKKKKDGRMERGKKKGRKKVQIEKIKKKRREKRKGRKLGAGMGVADQISVLGTIKMFRAINGSFPIYTPLSKFVGT